MTERLGWFDRIFDEPGSVRGLAVLRIALGPVVVVHLSIFGHGLVRGVTYRDHFSEPWVVWWQPPGAVQGGLVGVGLVAAVAMTVGWRTRWACAVTTTCVAANLFLSQHYFRHNRAFLLFLLLTVTLGASGRVLSLDARRSPPPDDIATIWPIWLMRCLASSVYFASGFSKLIDTDWSSGLVLWDRTVRYQHFVRESPLLGPLADPFADLITERWVHRISSPVAVGIELFLAAALWFPRTRITALWVAVFFHLSIQVSAAVEVFSLAALAGLSIWVTPSTRDRFATVPERWVGTVRLLDWFARFELRPGDTWQVIDRDGSRYDGRAGWWLVLSRLPLTGFVVAPLRPFCVRRDVSALEAAS